jgi:hypothetical protein
VTNVQNIADLKKNFISLGTLDSLDASLPVKVESFGLPKAHWL